MTTTMPSTSGTSPWLAAEVARSPIPLSPKTFSITTAPLMQGDELQRQHGQRRRCGVAQRVLEQHAAGRQPAAAQRAHVVLLQHVDHRAAGLGGDRGDRADGQRDRRQRDRRQPPARVVGEGRVADAPGTGPAAPRRPAPAPCRRGSWDREGDDRHRPAARWSSQPPRTAATTPRAMLTHGGEERSRRAPGTARPAERWRSAGSTGCLVNHDDPRSPCTAPASQSRSG